MIILHHSANYIKFFYRKEMDNVIFITGDTHGDLDDLNDRRLKGLKKGDKLIVTGDFGFIWDNSEKELKNLKKLSKKKFDILFVDGAHENHERLKAFREVDLYCAKGYRIDHNIYCLKRGEIYTIDGLQVLAIGGGLDPHIHDESEHPLSMPTDEELAYAVENIRSRRLRVDIIVTHEPPASVKRVVDRSAAVNDLNLFLDTVLRNTRFRCWYFGCLHEDRTVSKNLVSVWREVIRVEPHRDRN